MRRPAWSVLASAVLLGSATAHAEERRGYDAYFEAPAPSAAASSVRLPLATTAGVATSFDVRRSVPRFFWAARQHPAPPMAFAGSPEGAARWYAGEHARRWRLPREAVDNVEVHHLHDIGRGGIIVSLRHQIDGIEVFHGDVKVLMARNLELIAISGTPRSTPLVELRHGKAFKLTAPQALARALEDLYELPAKAASIIDIKKSAAGYSYFDLAPTPELKAMELRLLEPSRVKKVFYPLPDRLVPAYYLEISAKTKEQPASDELAYAIAADDGRVLYRENLTAHAVYKYRVWADPVDGRPQDGPLADFTPHPAGSPDGSRPAFTLPGLIPMEGFNHNPNDEADPWLPDTALQTLGNNVDAYTDDDAPDGYSNGDIRATRTSVDAFDRTYDLTAEPLSSQSQSMAALTQLFYTTNWLHDWWYDSGFNEAAGNAQQDNFGRGGVAGDPLHAEGQDGAPVKLDNANMTTPADGRSPKMQMFLWSPLTIATLVELPSTSFPTGGATFGPTNFDVTAEAVLVDDGIAVNTNGCEPFITNVTGKIAVVDRGACPYVMKATNAQAAGAIGLVVLNNMAGAPPKVGGSGNISIPALSMTLEDGAALKADMQSGPVTLHMSGSVSAYADGALDNTLIAHEWAHLLHHRLASCALLQCGAMSEGFADFNALQMMIRPDDDLDGTYALVMYAARGLFDSYYGIRRWPYTTDMSKNGLTFKHISDGVPLPNIPQGSLSASPNSQAHNTGEVWASMLLEGYVSLLKVSKDPSPRYTFEKARRVMSDDIVAGMMLAPPDATFTEQRDAILAASYALEPRDTELLADGFAKRGAGTCAVSPPRDSNDNIGVVESFTNQGDFAVLSLTVDDSAKPCDNDGILDAEEVGAATVRVMNIGLLPLINTKVTLSSGNAGVAFPSGDSRTLPNIDPFAIATVSLPISLDKSSTKPETLILTAAVENAASCSPIAFSNLLQVINYDNVSGATTVDTAESDIMAWKATGLGAAEVWARAADKPTSHFFHGADSAFVSDTAFESPALEVSTIDPFILSFKHAHSFEATPMPEYFDGGVIEISTNGQKWVDISAYASAGYGGTISGGSSNPLANRQAFVARNASFPAMDPVILDMGMALAGKTVKVRFRIGADLVAGDLGWQLDDIAFSGITNHPFPTTIDNVLTCPPPQPTGEPCKAPGDCQSGFCADAVCCDKACDAGHCDACSRAAGADQDGVCSVLLDCSPFSIESASCDSSPRCKTSCVTLQDCAAGFACDLSGKCVPPLQPTSRIDYSDCGLSPSSPSDVATGWGVPPGLMLLAALARRRRRRGAAPGVVRNHSEQPRRA